MAYTMDRRRLLSSAALGSAALVGGTALGSIAPEDALAAPPHPIAPGAPDPNFVEGRVTAVDGDLLRVTGSHRTLHRLRVTAATSVWKLQPTTADQAAVGDGLYARGVRLDDGTLAADSVWLNIVSLHVHLAAIRPSVLHLDHFGSRLLAHVVPGVSAAAYNGTPAVPDLSLLKVGAHAHVIGAWRPDTNELDLATIYAAA